MRTRYLLALLGVGIVLFLTRPPWPAWSETDQLFSPFEFHEPGQPPLLILRCGVLFFSIHVLRREPVRAMVVVAVFLLSLAARGLLYPFLVVAAGLVAPRGKAPRGASAVLHGTLATALAFAALPYVKRASTTPNERDPHEMVAYWRSRHNPYEARWWALACARQEAKSPSAAYLTLASIDWELGRRVQARKVLAKILDHPDSDAVHAQANALRTVWDASEPR